MSSSEFILRNLQGERNEHFTTYECFTQDTKWCECLDTDCTGNPKFCTILECMHNSTCICHLTFQKLQMVAIMPEVTLYNPDIIILETCFFDKQKHDIKKHTRRLLEGESAVFANNNLTISFNDPILHLPDRGRVILRNSDFEHILTVPADKMINIPFELLAYKTIIEVIYLSPNGHTVMGQIHVSGKTVCQLKYCILCKEIFHHLKCLPVFLQYFVYAIFCVLILATLLCVKLALKSCIFLFKTVFHILYATYKLLKFAARCSLLLGAFIGSTIRELCHKSIALLEMHAVRRANIYSLPLIIMLCTIMTDVAHSDCNTHSIIKSELKTCETVQDGSRKCEIYTTAEITLKTLSSETCLWFTDENNDHLFSLVVTLDAVTCSFHKERQYFTFPVKTKQLSQVSCIFNQFCGRGTHCIKRRIGKEGLRFESESSESREFPGYSACVAGGIGVGCTVLTRAACNFYRVWYEPDLLQSYEVSKIRGHSCQYHISVKHSENNTVSRLRITDSAITKNGIKVTVLGAYDQPQLHLNEMFIQRVGNPKEAFLAHASEKNFPKAGKIGSIQANVSFTRDFIFDTDLTTCDFFEDTLRCITAPDALERIRKSKEYSLPLQRDIHLFSVNENNLQSTLLLSSAVRIQLHFTNYKITVKTTTICPHFANDNIKIAGCYNCPVLARITFQAHSTCQAGVAFIDFQTIKIFSQAIHLRTEPTTHVVKFLAEQKCFSEKLCLKSPTLVQCKTIDFCMDEPTVELLNLNTNYTTSVSSTTANNLWDWIKFPNLNSTFFMFKFIGSVLLIICLLITTISTIITCCCRGAR